ncbi:MAG: CheR family methyltransferase [Deltaproteobacteria bacterium]
MTPNKAHDDKDPRTRCPVVAIGASAGGLDAFQRFLAGLPARFGFAVVFLQHLSPSHKSLLPELCRSLRTDLDIVEITDNLEIQACQVYVAPPGRVAHVRNGVFRLSQVRKGEDAHLLIDEFLIDLAEEMGDWTLAVILSGAGTDGARGIQAIKVAGGIVFAQDPASAQYTSMPLAAIDTGYVDSILPPDRIAREILALRLFGDEPSCPADDSDSAWVRSFYQLLHEKTGYRFDHYKQKVASRRIRRRMILRGVPTLENYLEMVRNRDAEAALLAADLMIGVTSFFRDGRPWQVLKKKVIASLLAGIEGRPIRVWTPACATGEEAYSIAMMLVDELDRAGKKEEIQIFATDMNDRALEKARAGRYPASVRADIPAGYVRKFFTFSEDGLFLVAAKDLRERIVFARQDLLSDPPFSRLDLIICRNLLIYLEPEAQERCISLFHYALNDEGYLFLGNAESTSQGTLFEIVDHRKCRIYLKKTEGIAAKPPLMSSGHRPSANPKTKGTAGQQSTLHPVIPSAQEALLEEFAPAAVAFNRHYELLYHNGPTHRYLRQPRGMPTQNLLELFPEKLWGRIRSALYRCVHEDRPVSIRAGITGEDDRKRRIVLRLSSIREGLYLLVFREEGKGTRKGGEQLLEPAAVKESALRQLEVELAATQDDLRSHIQQSKNVNEELHSSNEELQAANEELEISQEELQSLNEELTTVNAQLQSKIEELERINNDLSNFLTSTDIPTLFLDRDFKVKRFTPAIENLVRLIPNDVGRPIVDFSYNYLGPELIEDSRVVLERLSPVSREIDVGGRYLIRTVLPYRTSSNSVEGVVVTYGDVTELKRAEGRSVHLASFPRLNPNPVLEADASGRIIYANPGSEAILENLGRDKEAVESFLPPDLADLLAGWDKKSSLIFEREIAIGNRVFAETVHLVPELDVVRIYALDITKRKKADEALRESQERLKRSQEIAHLGGWELDLSDNILTWSDEVYRIFGLEPQEFGATYEAFLEKVHPEDRAAVNEAYLNSLRDGKDSYEIEHRVVRQGTGEIRHVHEKCQHFRDHNGNIIRSVGMVHDITERKQAEEALRFAKREWERTFASVPDMIAVLDNDHRILRVNESMARLLGRSTDECVGLKCYEVMHGTDTPLGACPHSLTIKDGHEHTQEVHEERLGMDLLVTTTPLNDEQGKMIGSVHVAHDITERKRAEAALEGLAQQRQLALDAARLGWWHYDPITRVASWDDRYKEIFGVTGYQSPKDEILARLNQDDLPGVWAKVEAALDPVDPQPYFAEYRINLPDGTMKWIEAYGIASFEGSDRDRRAVSFVGTVTDITERKRAEQALRQWSERHGILAEAARLLLTSEAPERVVQTICERVMEHLDCHAFFNFLVEEGTERMRLNAYAGIPEERAREIERLDFGVAVCGCVAREGKRIIAEDIANTADDRTELVKSFGIQAYACHPLVYQDRTIGTLSFGTCDRPRFSDDDITLMRAVAGLVATAMARKRIEDDLAQARDLAEERTSEVEAAIQDLEGFTYSVSHDLRAPIRHIMGFSDLLRKKCWTVLDEQGRKYLEIISGSSRKLGTLTDELLEFSRMGRAPMKKGAVDLTALVGEVVKSFVEQTKSRQIEWSVGDLPTVEGDASMLRFAIVNLLANAVKFTSKKEKACIEVGHREEKDAQVIYVKDNGAGFDMRYVDKLFGVFQRLHNEADFEGTGIGLANVARIIHRHGGQVRAEGEVGDGAVFSFALPKKIQY